MKLESKGWNTRHGIGGGPRWRLVEFAEHVGQPVQKLVALARHDPEFPAPVGSVNQRSQPGGTRSCATYRLADLKAWWAKRQQKTPV